MLKNDLELNVSDGFTTYGSVAIMLLCTLIGINSDSKFKIKNTLFQRFKYFSLFILLISAFFSLFYPFGSLYLYGAIILPFFLFCFMAHMPRDPQSHNIVIWAVSIVALLLGYTFVYNNNLANQILVVENANNASYYCLYLFPFFLCHKRMVYRVFLILVMLGIVMLSVKRGGFIALAASLLVYILILQLANKGKKFSLYSIIIIILFIIGLGYAIVYINDNTLDGMLFDRMEKIEENGGAGRLDIYGAYLKFMANGSPLDWLFGHGWQGSIRASHIGVTCHNDFLESMVDFGIGGFALYILLHVALFRQCKKMIRVKHEYAPAMGASYTLFFTNSMVSHIIIYPWYLMSFALFWGFIVSSFNNTYLYKELSL